MVRIPLNLPYIPIGQTNANFRRRIHALLPLAVFLIVLGIFGFSALRFKERAADSAPKIYADFKAGAQALFGFNLSQAESYFNSANRQLGELSAQSPIKTVPAILNTLFQFSQKASELSSELADLQSNGLAMMLGKKGASLIQKFHNVQNQLTDIGNTTKDLKGQAGKFGYNSGSVFGDLDVKLSDADQFLTAFLNWLETPKKQRLLILFQNPSEMRPGGGFIGSYGVATLFQGSLLDVQTRDIYDPDGQLGIKVIPPKPLQGVTDRWGARDANWFFDFPTSARKVLEFLEASKIYSEQGIKFSGAVAVNVELIKDILDVIGPVELTNYKLTITSANFLSEVQREVEAGGDKTKGEPKRILKVLTPVIFDRLAGLNAEKRQDLFSKFSQRFASKDIMAYFQDKTIEDYLKKLNAAGEVARLPENFFGDYLAVVNASVGGGKSDAFIDQKINLISRLESDGRIHNLLSITRAHNGDKEKDWWYRSTNHDYIQVYAPPGANLLKIKGADAKTIKPLISYAGKGFSIDPDLSAIEKFASAFGKTVFTTWLDTKAGGTKEVFFDYYSPYQFNFHPGPYQFIFEKQSGAKGELSINLEAPAGFKWKESQSPSFTYSIRDLPGRLILDLNLEAIPR